MPKPTKGCCAREEEDVKVHTCNIFKWDIVAAFILMSTIINNMDEQFL
jgi:hypothetical protein